MLFFLLPVRHSNLPPSITGMSKSVLRRICWMSELCWCCWCVVLPATMFTCFSGPAASGRKPLISSFCYATSPSARCWLAASTMSTLSMVTCFTMIWGFFRFGAESFMAEVQSVEIGPPPPHTPPAECDECFYLAYGDLYCPSPWISAYSPKFSP